MANCLAVGQFEAAIASLPYQHTGLYLYENQAWEKALLGAWRRHGHGRLIGVQHATTPFWHLYYFDDVRSWQPTRPCGLPLPDLLAVNGAAARTAFAEAGFPRERLIDVEALRYLDLAGLVAERAQAVVRRDEASETRGARLIRVLILGDLLPTSTRHLLELTQAARRQLPSGYEFTFKPHPGYAAALADYPDLRAAETREPLAKVLGDFDIAIAANSTSAAVDAYVAGLRVIVTLDAEGLNLSPLRGQSGARFVSTAQELTDELVRAGNVAPAELGRGSFFHLDRSLSRWKSLLALSGEACIRE